MKKFFKQLALFILFNFLCFTLLLLFLSYFNKKLLSRYKIESSVNTIILGDSHVVLAINDHQLSHTINLSQPGEAFMFSYSKLQAILKNNSHINRVLLGCSYHNLSSYYDERMFGSRSTDISSRYFFILPGRLQFQLFWNNKNNRIALLREIIKTGFVNLSTSEKYSFLGAYENNFASTRVDSNSAKKRINGQYYLNGAQLDFSSNNILYLNKIIDLCKNRHIGLIILNTPMYTNYKNNVPLKFKNKFYSLINDNKLELIKFNNLNLDDSCFLPDGDHLSQRGAALTTQYLKAVLEKKQ